MKKRVYGIMGIKSIMSNWNADFTGYPKTTSDGSIFGSDKALKYPMKVMWNEQGEKVLYFKSFTVHEKKGEVDLIPRSLSERYEYLFEGSDTKDSKDKREVLKNLFNAIDVKNFGATFAEKGNNVSITGAVQIGQGFNEYEDSNAEEQQILSPFRDASKKESSKKGKEDQEEAKQSTLGTKIVSNEAHYFYPFAINPGAYDEFVALGVTEGYSEKDYQKFKATALVAATAFSTNAKIGCENEFTLFVETEPDLYLPNLAQYITFKKEQPLSSIQLSCDDLLNQLADRIKKIEIYYNPYTTELKHQIKNAKVFNLFTKKEV